MENNLFDAVAPRYDFINDFFSLLLHRVWRRKLIDGVDGDKGFIALDVCTGTGDTAIALVHRYPRARVIGIDISQPMLKRGRDKINRANLADRVELCVADGLRIPFADARFDAVCNSFGLRNEVSFEPAVREMVRALKPGGTLRILEFSIPENRLLRRMYLSYLTRVMPAVSSMLGAPQDAYRYLARTVQEFLTRGQVLELMRNCGLFELRCESLTCGIVSCYHGRKPLHYGLSCNY